MTDDKNSLHTIRIPAVTMEFAKHLQSVFRPIDIKPNSNMDEIKFSAGEQKVINYILRQASGEVLSGNPDDIRNTNEKGKLDKLLGKHK